MKKKTAKKVSKETLVVFVLDETASMTVHKSATISGFNEYIQELSDKGGKVKFSLTKFNSWKTENVHISEDIKKITPLTLDTYKPNGITPLYDAIAGAVTAAKEIKSQAKLCVIMTDGEENASMKYTREMIFDLIKKKEKAGWSFVYLGADQDAWEIGHSIGLSKGNVKSYNSNDITGTFTDLAVASVTYCASNQSQTSDFFKGGK